MRHSEMLMALQHWSSWSLSHLFNSLKPLDTFGKQYCPKAHTITKIGYGILRPNYFQKDSAAMNSETQLLIAPNKGLQGATHTATTARYTRVKPFSFRKSALGSWPYLTKNDVILWCAFFFCQLQTSVLIPFYHMSTLLFFFHHKFQSEFLLIK